MRRQYGTESDSDKSDSEESYREKFFHEKSDSKKADPEDDKTRPDGDLRTQIFSTLKLIKTPSAFAYSAVDSFLPNPILYIPPRGTLGLPLSTDDALKLISQASQSPFGKGEETLIDITVRKSWELNPDQFLLKNPVWNKVIENIVDTVTMGLGLEKGTGKVSAELYKLLLYEPGAFFKPHKDSEKAPGMFATLVVCLPSQHEGGKLVLTHNNEKYEFETASSSNFSTSYAAWYSDITHEVLPVTSGYRLMLTYNLIRQTGIVIPSYNLVSEHKKQLSTLLEQYNSQLEKKDGKLPPVLLHILEHKYTKASLKLDTLKPPDLAQVQALTQLSTKLGFNIYLAVLVLTVKREDEYYEDEDEEKHQYLESIVELDGELIVERLDYPNGALIDPTPQKEENADKIKKGPYTGNAGTPCTYWYRDTAVFLVPPSEQLNFIYKFQSEGPVIDPLFCKLMQELSKDPAQKPKVVQLCERALKQKPREHYYYCSQSSETISPYVQQAAATALDLGRIDLFDEACKMTKDRIMLNNARMLGRWTANNGVAMMTERLMRGIQITSSVAEMVEFLKAVAEGFETVVPKRSSAERLSLKQCSDEAIFTAVAKLEALTEDDGMSLAQLYKTMDWSQFESKAKPIILKAVTMTKITFIKELMSALQQELDEEQRSFIKMIIHSIWNKFVFNAECHKLVPEMSSSFSWRQRNSPIYLNKNDVLHIVENTITILSTDCVETTIIPAMLTAIPAASKECAKELFILLAQMILKNKLPGFRLATNDAIPLLSHKRFVQALLIKFLLENVGLEPQPPTDWSLPTRSCNCKDCAVVNRFLRDPCKESLDFPLPKTRCAHLDRTFARDNRSTYDVKTIQSNNSLNSARPALFWRITKHRRIYEGAKSEWKKKIESAVQTLSQLKNDEPVDGRLEAYLQPYYSVIMNASVKELPDLISLVATSRLSEPNESTATADNQPTSETGHKREASDMNPPEDGLTKRTKL